MTVSRVLFFRGLVVVALVAAFLAAVGPKIRSLLLEPNLWTGFVAAQTCALAVLLLTGWTLLSLNGPPVRYRHSVRAVALALAMFLFLPSRLSEGLKPLYLTAVTGQPVSRGLAVVLVERFLDLCVFGCLIIVAIAAAASTSDGALMTAAIGFWSAVAVGCLGIFLIHKRPKLFDRIISFIPFARVRALSTNLIAETRETVAPHRLVLALCTVTATWLMSVALFQVFLKLAGSIELSTVQVLVVFVLSTAGLAIAVTPGGIGTFEAGFVASLLLYGYGLNEALLLAVVVRLASISVPLFFVAVMIIRGDVDIAGLITRLRNRSGKDRD